MSTHDDAELLRTIADRLDALDDAPTPQPATRTGGSVLGAAIGYLLMAVAGSVIVSLGVLALVEIWRAVL
ncbi:hypothetical protein [Actinomyces faecalis]|uniref:hypothetical protein n=1 Tax=Actinomyces faecalis TaxID=2722820 RepID=UPI001556EAC7|nr:hypothetical protein [Actinomyces faecalis]